MTVEETGKVDLCKSTKHNFLEIAWFLREKWPDQIFVSEDIAKERIHRLGEILGMKFRRHLQWSKEMLMRA